MQHDARTIGTVTAVVAHPGQGTEVLVDPENDGIGATVVRVARTRSTVQRAEVGARCTAADQDVAAARRADVEGVVRAIATDHGRLHALAIRGELQHEDVLSALRLLVDTGSGECASAQYGEVGAGCKARDVQVAVRTLFHGVGIVLPIATDVCLPYARARTSNTARFKVFADHQVHTSVGRYVEGAQGDLVRAAVRPGRDVDGPIIRIHPDAVPVIGS